MDALLHAQGSGGATRPKGHRTERIEGSFRALTAHQLTLVWWMYASGHMTRRQLRVYFALHEMAEKRRYGAEDSRPLYKLEEIIHLIGGHRLPGSGGEDGLVDGHRERTRADLARLRRLGLACFSDHAITFARSADEIRVDDMAGFWTMFEEIPNRRRTVPVPRRMLRALAAGFSRSVTALVIAMLIRGLFWHKQAGDYRTDGRYKLAWVAQVFGVARRSLTDARATLIDLGWLEPLEVNQIMMNRYGLHDRIVTDWRADRAVGGRTKAHGAKESTPPGSASPKCDFHPGIASPDLTDSPSLTGESKTTRKPTQPAEPGRAGPSGVSPRAPRRQGSRKKRSGRGGAPGGSPNIRDVQSSDLRETDRLLELHRQAVEIGLASGSESGRLAFLALAERARSRGKRAGALFYWLLRERKTAFITLHDEDEAARRLREHLNGPRGKRGTGNQWGSEFGDDCGSGRGAVRSGPAPQYTPDQVFVLACIRVANQHRGLEPSTVARAKGWGTERFEAVKAEIEQLDLQRWRNTLGDDEG